MIGLSIGLSRQQRAGVTLSPPTVTSPGTISSSYSGYPGAAHTVSGYTSDDPGAVFTFQWQDDGVNISGATSATATSAQTTGRSGALTCVVTATNDDGSDSDSTPAVTLTTKSVPTVVSVGNASLGVAGIVVNQAANKQAGDRRLVLVETANQTVATPSGFAALTHANDGTGTGGDDTSSRLSAFFATSAGSGTDTDASAADPGDHWLARELAVRGVTTIIRLGGVCDSVAASPFSWPSGLETPVDNCLIVLGATYTEDGTSALFGSVTAAALTNQATQVNAGSTQGNGGGLAIVTGTAATAGALGSMTGTTARTLPQNFARVVYAVIP
jgi:hypothetical protein